MKKITLLLLFCAISCAFSFAQSFHGVTLGQSLSATQQVFLNKGFTPLRSVEGIKYMKGTIAGDNYEIALLYTPTSKKVWKIVVYTGPVFSWISLKYQHKKFKDLLTKKYGEPTNDFWYFRSPYYEGDGFELQALRKEAMVSSVFFRDPEGNSIFMEMVSFDFGKGQIRIGYENAEAVKLYTAETEKIEKGTF